MNTSDKEKVLLVVERNSIFDEPILRSLRTMGFHTEVIYMRDSYSLRRTSVVYKALNHLPQKIRDAIFHFEYNRFDRSLVSFARQFKPKYICTLKAKTIAPGALDELRKVGTLINWYPDTMDNWNSIKHMVGHYDYFFNYDKQMVQLLREQGHTHAYHLPFAADLDSDAPFPMHAREYPVTFLGSYHPIRYPERLTFLEAIKGLGLHLWGNKAWKHTSLAPYYRGSVEPQLHEVMDIYRRSKIVIHSDLSPELFWGSGITLRPFDVTASGALLLAHRDRSELGELFKDGEEFVGFDDSRDLREKVVYYLHHEKERTNIARAGFQRTQSDHTYLRRMKTMFEIIKK